MHCLPVPWQGTKYVRILRRGQSPMVGEACPLGLHTTRTPLPRDDPPQAWSPSVPLLSSLSFAKCLEPSSHSSFLFYLGQGKYCSLSWDSFPVGGWCLDREF